MLTSSAAGLCWRVPACSCLFNTTAHLSHHLQITIQCLCQLTVGWGWGRGRECSVCFSRVHSWEARVYVLTLVSKHELNYCSPSVKYENSLTPPKTQQCAMWCQSRFSCACCLGYCISIYWTLAYLSPDVGFTIDFKVCYECSTFLPNTSLCITLKFNMILQCFFHVR